jgi:hypothetical protein
MLAAVALAVACTATQGDADPPTRSPVPPSGTTTEPAASASPDDGVLAVNLRVRYEGSLYTEGAIAFIEVRDSSGDIVASVRSKRARLFFRRPLVPGNYDVRTYLRPCVGSCAALDAPRDQCRSPVEMLADGSNRLVKFRVVAVVGECDVSDEGDVIDFDPSRPRSPSADVGVPYPIRLFTHCGIDQAAVDFDGSWWELLPGSAEGEFGDPFTKGMMTLSPTDIAVFRTLDQDGASSRAMARFVRHEGPIRLPGCY